jgi:hypothetical protein
VLCETKNNHSHASTTLVPTWVYIDKSNKVITPCTYDTASDFAEGLAHVVKGGLSYFIDKSANKMFDTPLDRSGSSFFSEGLAPMEFKEGWGYVNKHGETVIKGQFLHLGNFSEGLAAVELGRDTKNFLRTDYQTPLPGKVGYINNLGSIIIPPTFQVDEYSFTKAAAFHNGLARVRVEDRLGFISRGGDFVIKPQYVNAGYFSDGFVEVSSRPTQDYYTYVDVSGNEKFSVKNEWPPMIGFNEVGQFSEGMACIVEPHRAKRGFIDASGSYAIELKSSEFCLHPFSEGFADIKSGDKWHYIDRNGKQISSEFDETHPFSDHLAAVKVSGKWGFIDHQGSFVIEPQYKEVRSFHDGLAAVMIMQKSRRFRK